MIRIARAVKAVIFAAALAASAAPAAAIDQAWEDCGKGSGDLAIAGCSRFLSRSGENPIDRARAFMNRGVEYRRKDDLDRAIADYSEAIRLNPKYALAYYNRGIAFNKREEFDRAVADLNAAIRLNPNDPDNFTSRARAFRGKEEYDRAIADYMKALSLKSDSDIAYQGLGIAYQAKNDFARAIDAYTNAIRLDPKDDYSFNNRGLCYFSSGQNDRALTDFNEALRLDPKYARAFNNRALAFEKAGDADRSIADFEEAIRLDASFDRFDKAERARVYTARGERRARAGDLDGAAADLDRAAGFDPKLADPRAVRAYVLARRGLAAQADEEIAEAMKLGDTARTALYRGELRMMRRDLPGALQEFQVALARDPSLVFARDGRDAVSRAVGADAARDAAAREAAARETLAREAALRDAAARDAAGKAASLATIGTKRVALVIGNGAYVAPLQPLPNPPNDARDMAKTLRELGFDVTLVIDGGKREMEERIADFARAARTSDVALAFYAGHAIQHQEVNYLAPVDARLTDEVDLRQRFVKVQDLVEELQNARGARLLFLDACRDNEAVRQLAASLPRSRSASVRNGLSEMRAEGVLIAFATQPNAVAADGGGRNSPFTGALLKYLPTPGLEIRTMLTRVRTDVLKSTDGRQRPELRDSLDGEFAFR